MGSEGKYLFSTQSNTRKRSNQVRNTSSGRVAHEWWHYGLVTLEHDQVTSYVEFTKRLIDSFVWKNLELNFKDLAQLKKMGMVDSYITGFQRLSVLFTDIFERRQIVLFMDGLRKPLRGWIKGFNPCALNEAIKKVRDIAASSSKTHVATPTPSLQEDKDKEPIQKKPQFDQDSRQELRRKKLYFTCKEPWEPGHHFLGKGKIHYIEVITDDDEGQTLAVIDEEVTQQERINTLVQKRSSIATLTTATGSGIFRIHGTIHRKQFPIMIDSGVTLNFINSSLVTSKGLHAIEHGGFEVQVPRGTLLPCTHVIPWLQISMGNYNMIDEFFVIDLVDTDIILGIQWLETLDQHTQSFKRMDFSFKTDGKKVLLRGMSIKDQGKSQSKRSRPFLIMIGPQTLQVKTRESTPYRIPWIIGGPIYWSSTPRTLLHVS